MNARRRKGQGLSVNMIILIALGLVILVITILMFSRSTREGQAQSTNCALLGGICRQGTDQTTACASTQAYFGKCSVQGEYCCAKTESEMKPQGQS